MFYVVHVGVAYEDPIEAGLPIGGRQTGQEMLSVEALESRKKAELEVVADAV